MQVGIQSPTVQVVGHRYFLPPPLLPCPMPNLYPNPIQVLYSQGGLALSPDSPHPFSLSSLFESDISSYTHYNYPVSNIYGEASVQRRNVNNIAKEGYRY